MKNLSILILLFSIQFSIAQINIQGTVSDSNTQEIIMLADVSLMDKNTDEILYSTFSDEKGEFIIQSENSTPSMYLLIEIFGYESQSIEIDINHLPKNFDIKLQPNINQLSEAVIVQKKKAISIKGDKIIYDVELSGIGNGNNGLETMQQLPGVKLDKDENLVFRGSSGVQIMINGKKSMLQGDALREFIRSLNGDDIKSVEIISQPSARYDATGTTGILNIVLKKNRVQKLSGNIYTYGGYGDYFKHQTGSRLFYNDSLWSVNASGSYYNGKSYNDRNVLQTIRLGSDEKRLEQSNYWLPKTESKSFNLGVERVLTKNHLISTEWQWYDEKESALTTGTTHEFLNGNKINQVELTKESDTPQHQILGNLFYNYSSDSLTTKIEAQVNYGNYKKTISGFQRNDFQDASFMQLDGFNKSNYQLFNSQVDWNQKISDKLNLEAGLKYSKVDMDYFNEYKANDLSLIVIPDSLLINDFKYKEDLFAAYSQLSYNADKWSFMAGLRMENYRYDAKSVNTQEINSGNDTNWFPSASLGYEVENNQFRLSYSRRIQRPNYLDLNPYYEYLDSYSLETGNPYLKPQMYHSMEFNYIYKNSLNFSLYGYLYQDGFIDVIDYQSVENYNILYKSNASKGSQWGFNATIPYEVGKWWSMQLSLDAYLESEKSEIPNYAYDGEGYGYDLSLYQKFTLPKSWTLTWNGFYSGRSETPTGFSPEIFDFSFSIKKFIWNDKLQFLAGCSNVLKNSMYKNTSTVNQITTNWTNRWETRRFYLQITYNFGGGKKKEVKQTSLDDEQNRM